MNDWLEGVKARVAEPLVGSGWVRVPRSDWDALIECFEMGERLYAKALTAIAEADKAASKAHDAIYAEPFDKRAASDAIWEVHNWLRPMIPVDGDE